MRKAFAIVMMLAITSLVGILPTAGDYVAARPFSQDESTGPYNPNLPPK